jgi:proline dehydrogenase
MKALPTISFEDTAVAFCYKSDGALKKARFIFSLVSHPWISALATNTIKFALQIGLPIENLIRKTVFFHFCGGESIEKSQNAIDRLAAHNVHTILDYSVEGENTEAGFDATLNEVLRTLEKAKNSTSIPFSVFKMTGLADANLLEKIQRKENLNVQEQNAWVKVRERVDKICEQAFHFDVSVLIDAEETWIQNSIDLLALEMMSKYNTKKSIVYATYQLYRRDSLALLQNAVKDAQSQTYFFGVKLVRGAYMEKERERAMELGFESPIHPTKDATDKAFNKALAFCMQNKAFVSIMCGSHNEYSNHYLTELMAEHDMEPNDERVWFAQLYGMSDNISLNLAKAGYRVAKYVPYGPVKSVMPYLFRRAEENTSVAGQSSRELNLINKELKRRRK